LNAREVKSKLALLYDQAIAFTGGIGCHVAAFEILGFLHLLVFGFGDELRGIDLSVLIEKSRTEFSWILVVLAIRVTYFG
jgi:hypothetical protein